MITPDLPSFNRLSKRGNLTAVVRTVPADLETPVSAFLKIAAGSRNAFFLESAEQQEKIGRYSVIGLDPRRIFISEKGAVKEIRGSHSIKLGPAREILAVLQKTMAGYKISNPESIPGFTGGLVGYLAYENVEFFEDVRLKRDKKGPDFPDAVFFLSDQFLIFDHFQKTLSVVVLVDTGKKNAGGLYRAAVKTIEGQVKKLRRPMPPLKKSGRGAKLSPKPNMTRAAFETKVRRIKEYIRAGDCIQVVLSQRFTLPAPKTDDFAIYRALRIVNPSPNMFYFRAGRFRLIGSSPEVLVTKTGREATVRPIAGTRPRGATPAEDLAHEENMKKSPKEMAEHLMLVDLARNDLGRVSEFDSIRVKHYARVERYSHVMHLVSDVTGKLKSGMNSFDLLKATFPAGTVSGAPKIRAMQIIDELEPEKRGAYAGCLGYFGFNGDMNMCITIRTLVMDGRKAYLQAGAGIVKDSGPAREYQETVNKAGAVLKAFSMQGDF